MAALRSSEGVGATLATLQAYYSWVLKLCAVDQAELQ
jgi:hypothetical protein